MPTLHISSSQATSGLIATKTVENKPIGPLLIIRRITVSARVGALLFAKVYGKLYNISNTREMVGLFNKTVVADAGATCHPEVFRGAVEWPQGYSLRLSARVQAANETIRWVIEYDIIEVDPRKKRWGE